MIHQYKSNGYNIVLDVNSGSVHVVDDIVYDVIPVVEQLLSEKITDKDAIVENVIKTQNQTDKEQIAEAVEEILELKEAGMLFTEISMKNISETLSKDRL